MPLCLGGADAAQNRWPQPRWASWNSYEKDRLEGYACRMVCAGLIDLSVAQRWFLAPADWRDAYRRIFGDPNDGETTAEPGSKGSAHKKEGSF